MPSTWDLIDFSYSKVTTLRDEHGAVTGYEFTVTYCNLTKDKLRVLVTENPWLRTPGSPKEGVKLHVDDPPGTEDWKFAEQKARAAGKYITLEPKGDAEGRDCVRLVWRFRHRPVRSYSDAYTRPFNEWNGEDKPGQFPGLFDDAWIHTFGSVKFGALLPHEPPPMYAVTFPVYRPMALDSRHKEAALVQITNISGLPDVLELSGIFPPLNKPVPLSYGDRNSFGALFLRPRRHLETTQEFLLTIRQEIVEPARLAKRLVRMCDVTVRLGT